MSERHIWRAWYLNKGTLRTCSTLHSRHTIHTHHAHHTHHALEPFNLSIFQSSTWVGIRGRAGGGRDRAVIQDDVIQDAITKVATIIEKQPNAGHPSGFIGPENAAIVAQKQVRNLRGGVRSVFVPLSCERG